MIQLAVKSVSNFQSLFNTAKQVFRTVNRLSTGIAHDVMVTAFFGMMVDNFIVDLALEYTVQLFQKLQRTVDRRFVDSGHLVLHYVDDVFGGDMISRPVKNIQNQLPLRGQLESFFFENNTATHSNYN
jgi:hypothetical protein